MRLLESAQLVFILTAVAMLAWWALEREHEDFMSGDIRALIALFGIAGAFVGFALIVFALL